MNRCVARPRLSVLSLAGGLLVAVLSFRPAVAQDSPELTEIYGRGVHNYFGGQVTLSDDQFSEVINAGSTDPRVYYFRGLARLRTGRQHEAEQDLAVGASYEARDPGASGAIGRALTRVQGSNRQLVER